jgi:hypothetical protein
MHIINDYTNQISKYVDVEYGLYGPLIWNRTG